MDPTPGGASIEPSNVTVYLGEELALDFAVQQLTGQEADILTAGKSAVDTDVSSIICILLFT